MPPSQKTQKIFFGKDWVLLLSLVVIIPAWVLYFYIFFSASTDLQQMRRILLAGLILPLSGLMLLFIVIRASKNSTAMPLRSKGATAIAVIVILSTMVSFHTRLSDSFRHAYASAFLAYYINPETAQSLGNLVEWVTSYKKYNLFNTSMDQCNNHAGRQIGVAAAASGESWMLVEKRIEEAHKSGALILSKHQHNDIIVCYKNTFPTETAAISAMQKYEDSLQKRP